jgi:hypothetical protein
MNNDNRNTGAVKLVVSISTTVRRALQQALGACILLAAIFTLAACGDSSIESSSSQQTPNILFIIMDDVGIDQMKLFKAASDDYSAGDDHPASRAANTPNIQAIADGGIRFSNTWSMPACSTSRAVFFTGRYPLRTNVLGALGPDDLANAQVSPFEHSLPKLLKQRGYQSALFGKYHIGLQGNNPYGLAMPTSLGWDYFSGWLDETGDPHSIDVTAGLGKPGESDLYYACGFVTGTEPGACYSADGSCEPMSLAGGVPPGRSCRDSGGIFDQGAQCASPLPKNILDGFQNRSGHYVSPLVIDDARESNGPQVLPLTDPRARTYRGSVPVDAAVDWIQSQAPNQPWMATVSFASVHTPVMQPPQALLTSNPIATSELLCSSKDGDDAVRVNLDQRELTTLMLEAMDTEIARLLVSIGVARLDEDGELQYDPDNSDTMIVILGDNGTLAQAVRLPFDPTRAKGTAYQTGVWVPLIIAGPLVNQPNRSVTQMVNIADLYQLFGEIADIDVAASVPRRLDAMPMLAYLESPGQASIRSSNFTQVGPNVQANGAVNGPCTIGGACTQIPVNQSVCEDNNGTWWGKNDDGNKAYSYCCEVNQDMPDGKLYNLQPLQSIAIRNDSYKVVWNYYKGNPSPAAGDLLHCDDNPPIPEFYNINETEPKIDYAGLDLMQGDLNDVEQANYDQLTRELQELLATAQPCEGDGNIDGQVNSLDETDYATFANLSKGNSSWYDINLDGKTDSLDLDIVRAQQGTACAD